MGREPLAAREGISARSNEDVQDSLPVFNVASFARLVVSDQGCVDQSIGVVEGRGPMVTEAAARSGSSDTRLEHGLTVGLRFCRSLR